MLGSRSFRALMRRNAVYRKRNWVGSLFEFFLPIFFVGVLVLIKSSVQNTEGFSSEIIPAYYPGNQDTWIPFTFTDYVTAMQAERFCKKYEYSDPDGDDEYVITGIAYQGWDWPVPFVKCDSRKCEEAGVNASDYCEYFALGLVASTEADVAGKAQAEAFGEYIMERYPQLDTSAKKFNFDFIQYFESDAEVESYVKQSEYTSGPKLAMAIVFDGTDSTVNYNYRLRVNSTNFNAPENEGRPATSTTPPTGKKFSTYAKLDEECPTIDGAPELGNYGSSCTAQYIYNGALPLQRLIGDWIMTETGAKSKGYYVAEHGVQYASFPSIEYKENGFYAAIAGFAPLLITLGLLYPVAAIIRYITLEKELRQKELMLMMSVTESDIGWSWFLSFFLFHLVTATVTAFITTKLYENSSAGLLWIFWEFTFLSIITFAMFLAAFFTQSTRATLVGLLLFFVGYFLTLIVDIESGSISTIGLISLHPVAAFSYGLQEIGRLEDLGIGLTSDTISSTDSESGYTFTNSINSFIFDIILWGILSWYSNRVVRSDFGAPLPFYFPFTASYWCPGSTKAHLTSEEGELTYDEGIVVEQPSNALKDQMKQGRGIQIRNLRKTFGEKTAVEGLSMEIFSNQITALLGHNGAGKTTTISMLTGMLEATEGYATVSGKDIRNEMTDIRQEIGICLQHDCLFPELTVREHIQFFARIKGMYAKMSHEEAEVKIDGSVQDVALSEKSNTLSKNLSGGMKRKLSVAIAFCGDSKTVLLDEPTSGMDPFSRRFTWNVIRQYRQDRCIILTTHFMDEADILGDRIAIMSEGRLRCLGSSLFLKKTYGVGYQLTIEKKPKKNIHSSGDDKNDASVDQRAVDDKLEEIVKGAVPKASLLSNVGTEMSYQLPLAASAAFSGMFEQLDVEADQGNVVTYGVGVTTLDEVFLLVARGGETSDKKSAFASSSNRLNGMSAAEDADKSVRSRMDLENDGLVVRHIGALFKKRAVNFKRDKKAWLCTTILPSLFVLIGFLLFKFVSPDRNLDAIEISLNDFNSKVTPPEDQPRNPIPFNSPSESAPCQPGVCFYGYGSGVIEEDVTEETYFYCGIQSTLEDPFATCSIEVSESITSQITEAGAGAEALIATDVRNASYALEDSARMFAATQYGALFFTHDKSSIVDISGERENYTDAVYAQCIEGVQSQSKPYVSPLECNNYGGIGYTVRYNYTAIHAAPLYQSLADEAIVREALDDDEFKIKVTIHPLPLTKSEASLGAAEDGFSAWFLIILSFPFITGSFATFVVAERLSKAKHLQTVAGVKPFSYWVSTWLWDVANYQIPLWITVILMFAFDVNILTTTERGVVGGIITLLFLFGPAAASFTYCITFLFSSPSICNLVIIISGFLIGFGGSLASFILRLIGEDPSNPKDSLVTAADSIEWVLRFIPAFSLAKGIFNAINIETFEYLAGEPITVWHSSVMRLEVIFLAWQSIGYLLLAMKIDEWSSNPRAVSIWQSFIKIITFQFLCSGRDSGEVAITAPEDSDVVAEQQRVLTGGANDDLIVVSQLTKVYDTGKVAVNNISFGVPPGQCFGLLGINGAGKTTTMGIMTAEFPPTSGDATLAGFSVSKEPEKTRRRVGYCPQFDAHFTNMTGREHVELYASIKGIPADIVKEASARKLAEVGLSDLDSDRLSVGYSGGMKRRLSLACATIGQPQIVFLDECSTGVDPVARREIWQMISDMVTGGNIPEAERTSVILTTHSMEECEALCPNIAIMAGGKLRCLGSAQQLKSKFGQGYQVEMKVKNVEPSDADYVDNLSKIAEAAGITLPTLANEEGGATHDEIFMNLDKAMTALAALTGDTYLTDMVSEHDPAGYTVFKEASSPVGIDLDGLVVFATSELRMRKLNSFIAETYPKSIVRERQDTKARYELSSQGVRIGNIFSNIEEYKADLQVSEYGVSQTSLEQVFNMHAAEAEKLKQGTNDA